MEVNENETEWRLKRIVNGLLTCKSWYYGDNKRLIIFLNNNGEKYCLNIEGLGI
tara:strand:+ start:70 stop:231 length:162 start_codon:yes stop_codon:yes gene_type:complete